MKKIREAFLGKIEEIKNGISNIFQIKYRLRHKDGHYLDMLAIAHVVKDDFGRPKRIIGTQRDITRYIEFERQLKKSEDRFKRIFESMTDVYYETDELGCLTELSPSVELLLGYKPHELIGRQLSDLYTFPEERDKFMGVIMSRGRVNNYEVSLQNKNGDRVDVSSNTQALFDENKQFRGVLGMVRNVTVKIQAERRLRESEERYKMLSNLTFEGIIIHENGVLIDVNQSFCEITQYSREELIGKSIIDLAVPPEYHQIVIEKIKNKDNKPYEIKGRRKDGTIFPVESEARDTIYNGRHVRVTAIRDITERKITLEALRLSEEKFRTLAENIPGVIYLCQNDPRWTMLYLNDNIKKLTGYSKERFLSGALSFTDIYHPDDKDKIYKQVQKALSNHQAFNLEYRIKHANGTWKYLEEAGIGVYDVDENLIHLEGYLSDITKRKESERALKESEEKFRTLIESIAGAFWIKNMQTNKIEYISPQYAHMWDSTVENLFRDPADFTRRIHPEDLKRMQKVYQHTYSANPFNDEYRIITGSGEIKYIRGHSNFSFDETGKLLREYGYVEDITAHKESEEEIRKLALVAQKTDNAVVITDKDGKVEWVNEAFTHITGFRLDEIIGQKPGDILQGPESEPKVIEAMHKALKECVGITTEIINYRKNGEKYWLELSIQPVLNDSNEVVKFISIQSDITDRKANEAAIRQHNQQLEKTNQELDNFVYRVSHDLKAPISSAKGLINIARLEKEPFRIDECLRLIEDSMNKLDAFILDILDYSRNARMTIIPEKIDLKELIDDIFKNLEYIPDSSRINRVVNISGEEPIYSDQRRLNFIFNNLISNALRFCDRDKEQSEINIEVLIDRDKMIVKFQDNGIGIDEKHLGHIFDMFYRATEKQPGSGLGLYIVKEAVEKLKGTIEVESSLGVGTTFHIEIPNQSKD